VVVHTRQSFTALARELEVATLSFVEGVLEAGPDDDKDGDGVTTSLLLLLLGKGDDLELTEEIDELAAEDVELELVDGGGTAALSSTSLPTPQGIGSPEGCLELAGGVVEPSGASMVNRVVQVLVVVCLEVNW